MLSAECHLVMWPCLSVYLSVFLSLRVCVCVCRQSLGVGRQSVCIADADKLVWEGWSILPELISMTHTQPLCVGVCAYTSVAECHRLLNTHTRQFKLAEAVLRQSSGFDRRLFFSFVSRCLSSNIYNHCFFTPSCIY